MSTCSSTLSTHQRRVLQSLLAKESQIVEQCNHHTSQFARMLNDLQCINHVREPDERTLKCDEFIRGHASLACDMTVCWMVPEAMQIAMTGDCVCIQAACFRILYKWIPMLDTLRMKLLKIKNVCATAAAKRVHVPQNGVELCAAIEKTVRKMLQTASSQF
jgi:hypothetical protein